MFFVIYIILSSSLKIFQLLILLGDFNISSNIGRTICLVIGVVLFILDLYVLTKFILSSNEFITMFIYQKCKRSVFIFFTLITVILMLINMISVDLVENIYIVESKEKYGFRYFETYSSKKWVT